MNIENERDLQVWLELYKGMITDNPEVTFDHCANAADESFKQYKKRAKALEEAKANKHVSEQEDGCGWVQWHGPEAERIDCPFPSNADIKVVYRDGTTEHGHVDDFSWTHLDDGTDIVKFKFV